MVTKKAREKRTAMKLNNLGPKNPGIRKIDVEIKKPQP